MSHVDMELGGVAAGNRAVVGFQYLKPAEALFAAQAIAHDDFEQAATQFANIFKHQKPDGLLPHLVYGPSVPSSWRWIPSNRTFHPGPAFWQQATASEEGGGRADKAEETSRAAGKQLQTSTVLAPPVAADVAWEIFRLAPYDSVLGVRTAAVQFLCGAYEPLKKLQWYIFSTRRGAANGLLASHTFSSLSPHWKGFLTQAKHASDYPSVVREIPGEARARFAKGADSVFAAEDAVENLYEPMIYLAARLRGNGDSSSQHRTMSALKSTPFVADANDTVMFTVEDVEFNSLMLRSAMALVNIGRVLAEHSSVCDDFPLTTKQLLGEVDKLRSAATGLERALAGTNTTKGLWNAADEFFDDASVISTTSMHSLRGFLPAYAAELGEEKKMCTLTHFLAPADSFSFFCTQFPAPFFACAGDTAVEVADATMTSRPSTTTWNKFPGLAEYVRNKTRDMVCAASSPAPTTLSWFPFSLTTGSPAPTALGLVYDSRNASALNVFDDSYMGSTLAAAVFLNILLPAGKKSRAKSDRRREDSEDRGRSSGSSWVEGYSESSYSDYSQQSGNTPYELEESLISEEDEHYGSFDEAEREETPSNSAWKAAKNALAAISPW
ncbi:hypothetical protein BBJ28_00007349 [Nothophytophthora sp. Chile5]|nr:hypothetical protein BBJ28_00007349 [Nothophytophthora sp. Chile5]